MALRYDDSLVTDSSIVWSSVREIMLLSIWNVIMFDTLSTMFFIEFLEYAQHLLTTTIYLFPPRNMLALFLVLEPVLVAEIG